MDNFPKKYSVTKAFRFEAAHNLPGYEGVCANLHGHSYRLEVTVEGEVQTEGPNLGMVVDFSDLKRAVDYCIIKELDHKNLNDVLPFRPTAELMAAWILGKLLKYSGDYAKIKRVRLWETGNSYAEVEV